MLKDFIRFINSLYPENPARVRRFSSNVELIHAVMGMSEECGEVTGIIKKCLVYGKDFDRSKLVDEMGDVLHYFLRVAELSDISLDEIVICNEGKLRKRFPNGYSDSDAIDRRDI